MGNCCVTQETQPATLWWPKEVGWGEGREAQEEGNICIIMADSHCWLSETNTTLWSNFPPIKKLKKYYVMNLKCWHHWLYLGFNYDSTTHTLMMYSDKKKKKPAWESQIPWSTGIGQRVWVNCREVTRKRKIIHCQRISWKVLLSLAGLNECNTPSLLSGLSIPQSRLGPWYACSSHISQFVTILDWLLL